MTEAYLSLIFGGMKVVLCSYMNIRNENDNNSQYTGVT